MTWFRRDVYRDWFPNRRHPKRADVIVRDEYRVCNNLAVVPSRSREGLPNLRLLAEQEVLDRFRENPTTITRRVGR